MKKCPLKAADFFLPVSIRPNLKKKDGSKEYMPQGATVTKCIGQNQDTHHHACARMATDHFGEA